jgi:hypothetical protein
MCKLSLQSELQQNDLLRNWSLTNQKKSDSCRCICRKSCTRWSSCNDVTYFSNGCCNVGCLKETALLGLKVSWLRFSEAEFPLDARVSLSSLGLLESIGCAVNLSAHARDTAQQEEEEECAGSNLRRVTV